MPEHSTPPAAAEPTAVYLVAIYHNTQSRFFPYEDGHQLTQVITHWRHESAGIAPMQIADWAFAVFNADLDMLETGRGTPRGEADFLNACIYRLMRRRSLSVGDVIAVTAEGHTTWLACESIGWRTIDAPANLTGESFTAETVYRHIVAGGDA